MPDKSQSEIVVRDISAIEEMGAVEELQREVWACADIDVVPRMLLHPAREVGGVLVGAYRGTRLVGFAFGLVGLERGTLTLHSHMLAVLPNYRGRDLGYLLKLAQRERAEALGITRMTWTFDPLQSRNAHLNFAKLGVVSNDYRIDYYGDVSTSPLHQGIGTDRLWVTWQLDGERVKQRIAATRDDARNDDANAREGEIARSRDADRRGEIELSRDADEHGESTRAELERSRAEIERAVPLVGLGEDDAPEIVWLAKGAHGGLVSIEIPDDINELARRDLELARRWREATRGAFRVAFAAGYAVEEFFRVERNGRRRGAYLLRWRGSEASDERD
jgi:predicted GNAT superfamily acetyltransferase